MVTKFIIICATGRSGSTTLQRIVNTIKDSNISGESWSTIINLLECYHNIKKTNNQPGLMKVYIEGVTKKNPLGIIVMYLKMLNKILKNQIDNNYKISSY